MIRAYIPSLHERHWPPFEYENGLPVPGILVEDVATTAKTLPGFVGLWDGMLAGRPAQ